jgi:cytosine/adenosine deaminase-related metal-dependent hydrolase
MILRARAVVPISRAPLEDGAVQTLGKNITWVGRWSELPAAERVDVVDLGESILLPGLVNAHCHLDYTNMVGKLAPPRRFTNWIQSLVALKATWTDTDFASSWIRGSEMLLRTGTTTVADIESVPTLIPAAWEKSPLRIISFRELIALRDTPETAAAIRNSIQQWIALDSHTRVGLSPHAPYTTTAALLQEASALAREKCWPLVTHVAESEEEFEMFMYRTGPLFDWLKSQRDMSDCGHGSPIRSLEKIGYLKRNLIAAHVNYVWRDDVATLARRRVNVVHCPHSHDYFRHLQFPYADLRSAGVNVCLGTDSLATVRKRGGQTPELNMFREMQEFAAAAPDVPPSAILKLATVNGAQALGRKGRFGELTSLASADLIAVPFNGSFGDVYESIIHHSGDVLASMIEGQWALPPR